MIIGNGLIAKAFRPYKDRTDIIIFASGVSNSQNTDRYEFEREISLLLSTLDNNIGKLVIYFSSCSIQDPTLTNSQYVRHKLNVEEIIKSHRNNSYIIVRVSNPVGNTTNQNTLINFLFTKIKNGESFKLFVKSKRNLLDIDDIYKITNEIIASNQFINQTINVANSFSAPVLEIVHVIEKMLGKTANYSLINDGGSPVIDITDIVPIINHLGLKFNDNYIEALLDKYYNDENRGSLYV